VVRGGGPPPFDCTQGVRSESRGTRQIMIAHLRGRLLEKHPNRVVVDVQGVGYDVHVPLSTFYEMAEAGGEIALRIHTHVREDALLLYGFATALELQLFERLISVSGIGPKLALAVLSGIEPNELVNAIRQANVGRLTAIPGVGKKTAERIGLELKDKMATFLPSDVAISPAAVASETLRTDVLSALVNLGYHRPLAERALDAALKAIPGGPFEQTLKYALRELAK
jgi:holliday junction DNA helicase RuvA